MTRVLHVLEALEGGTARHVGDLVRWVDGVEHHVAIPDRRVGGVTDRGFGPAAAGAGAVVHRLEMRRAPAHPVNGAALVHLRRLVRRLRPDVVHGHSAVGGALARLATWDLGGARVYTPNGLMPTSVVAGVERRLGRRTDRIIAVSASEARFVAVRGIPRRGALVTIANGIDPNSVGPAAVDLRELAGASPDQPLIGMVGRLVPQKAPVDFVAAAAALAALRPDARFVLVGSGRLRRRVEAAVERSGLADRLTVVPAVERVASALGQLDQCWSTSRWEGGPYVPLEAMRAGTPVVLTEAVGNRDVVEHGVSGLLVPVGRPEAMAEAGALLLADDALRRRLVEAGRTRVAQRFDVRAMARSTGRVYSELAGG
ncbi:MAG TPA: glycosyltransferase family 4 protein [Acidimicrobiales bacterium]|nr:glycosyltransferase family 4 protein [Acidimicrobiales bacterium]